MEPRFAAMRRGAGWVAAAQGSILLGQFVYGAITARIFAPEAFGAFAAALSLQATLAMATTTGVPSYVLMRPVLSSGDLRRVRALTVCLAFAAGAVFWLTLPLWLDFLGASEGLVFRGALTAAQVAAPIAALELALVRRQRKARRDATIFALSTVGGLVFAAFAAAAYGWIVALALAPLATSVITVPAALLAQGAVRGGEQRGLPHDNARAMLRYLVSVSGLNAIHFTITQIPTWVLSRTFGTQTLGYYTRATSLTATAATGLSASATRLVQPYWRDLSGGPQLENALRDALRVTANVSFGLFAVAAVTAYDFVALWLGPGWEVAGQMAMVLAVGAGAQVPFAVLSNAFEMRRSFRVIRGAQIVVLAILALGGAMAAWQADVLLVVALFALAPVGGLMYLIVRPRRGEVGSDLRVADLSAAAVWSAALALSTLVGLVAAHTLGWQVAGDHHLAALCAGGITLTPMALAAWRWHPELRQLRLRARRQTGAAAS